MKVMKRLAIAVMLLGVLAGCLAGCSAENATTGGTPSSGTPTQEPTTGITGNETEPSEHVHTYSTKIWEEDATCVVAGYKTHYTCFGCDKVFDENKNEIDESQLIIPAKGHDFDENYKCRSCKLDLGEVVTAIDELPEADGITLSSLTAISEAVAKYEALDDVSKAAVAELTTNLERLNALSAAIEGISVGVKSKYLSDAGQNQTLTDVVWTAGVDEVYGSYMQIDYTKWQWVNLKYNSSTRAEDKVVVFFVYNATETEQELTWGAADPAQTGCIYVNGIGWQGEDCEDPDTGHFMLQPGWNTVIIEWKVLYGFSGNLLTTGHYADAANKVGVNGWKFSDVYMMDADKLPLMEQIIANSVQPTE